ncbi:hypothetical protein ABTD96_20445, partial [Acinetobacter baumannii]
TRRKVSRYAKTFPDSMKICRFLDRDGETSRLEMAHPTRAATAIWILMNQDNGFRSGSSAVRESQ